MSIIRFECGNDLEIDNYVGNRKGCDCGEL